MRFLWRQDGYSQRSLRGSNRVDGHTLNWTPKIQLFHALTRWNGDACAVQEDFRNPPRVLVMHFKFHWRRQTFSSSGDSLPRTMDDRRSMWSSPVLRQLILGCYDTTSTLSCLRGHRELMQLVVAKIIQAWEAHIDQRAGGLMQLGPCMYGSYGLPKELQGTIPKRAIFPAPWNEEESFYVNMMPFIMGDMSSLPPSCQRYSSMIQACLETNNGDEIGRVGYLTIYEGVVEAGACQGPSGLRVELVSGGHCGRTKDSQMRALGFEPYRIYGGTYMASNAILSCRVYNSMIKNAHEVAGHLGDVEHLRWILDKHGEKRYLHHELFWIPAGIPYESVPLQMTQHRQYFRLVTSSLTHWNADHSTPNPLGIQPAAQIVHGEQI